MGPGGPGAETALPTGWLFVPGDEGTPWTGWARTSVGHFSSFGGTLPLHGQMRMSIFRAEYEIGRVLARVAVAHGRGEGSLTPAGLDRVYSAHSSLTLGAPVCRLRPFRRPDGVGAGRLRARGVGTEGPTADGEPQNATSGS